MGFFDLFVVGCFYVVCGGVVVEVECVEGLLLVYVVLWWVDVWFVIVGLLLLLVVVVEFVVGIGVRVELFGMWIFLWVVVGVCVEVIGFLVVVLLLF